jgi:hypothetical protein
MFRADGGDDAREAKVYACSKEGRTDGQADDLDEKRALFVVSILMMDSDNTVLCR